MLTSPTVEPEIRYSAQWSLGSALKTLATQIKSYINQLSLAGAGWSRRLVILLVLFSCLSLTACGGRVSKGLSNQVRNIREVSPPVAIAKLSKVFDQALPQVQILTPLPDQVVDDNQVDVKIKVTGLPIFKNKEFGLGPHVHVALDGQEYKALYDQSQTLTFKDLAPGSHTLRAFASRPWHESFKNKSAYAQVTFHVLTPTQENTPASTAPLLTYSRPVATYGAEPVMLDFYLHNASFLELDPEQIPDWRIKATVNGESFVVDRWQAIYLEGLKTGKNWLKLELIDSKGQVIPNAYSSTAHVFTYQPNGSDTLSRITRGESIPNLEAITNPNYVAPVPAEAVQSDVAPVVPPVAKEESPEEQKAVEPKPETEPLETAPLETEPVAEPAPAEMGKLKKRLKLKVRRPSIEETPLSE